MTSRCSRSCEVEKCVCEFLRARVRLPLAGEGAHVRAGEIRKYRVSRDSRVGTHAALFSRRSFALRYNNNIDGSGDVAQVMYL